MPGETQSIQELVPGLDGEVATMATSPKQAVVVWVTGRATTVMRSFLLKTSPYNQKLRGIETECVEGGETQRL